MTNTTIIDGKSVIAATAAPGTVPSGEGYDSRDGRLHAEPDAADRADGNDDGQRNYCAGLQPHGD